jgi:hypothetical protein
VLILCVSPLAGCYPCCCTALDAYHAAQLTTCFSYAIQMLTTRQLLLLAGHAHTCTQQHAAKQGAFDAAAAPLPTCHCHTIKSHSAKWLAILCQQQVDLQARRGRLFAIKRAVFVQVYPNSGVTLQFACRCNTRVQHRDTQGDVKMSSARGNSTLVAVDKK